MKFKLFKIKLFIRHLQHLRQILPQGSCNFRPSHFVDFRRAGVREAVEKGVEAFAPLHLPYGEMPRQQPFKPRHHRLRADGDAPSPVLEEADADAMFARKLRLRTRCTGRSPVTDGYVTPEVPVDAVHLRAEYPAMSGVVPEALPCYVIMDQLVYDHVLLLLFRKVEHRADTHQKVSIASSGPEQTARPAVLQLAQKCPGARQFDRYRRQTGIEDKVIELLDLLLDVWDSRSHLIWFYRSMA